MKGDVCRGFRCCKDEGGTRIECVMPHPLEGAVSASFLARGRYMDGTEGNPSRVVRAVAPLLGGKSLIAPWQVHGTAIVQARPIWAFPQRPRADGVHLDPSFDPAETTAASLRFAYCAPIVLASDTPHPWTIVLHSGFQGTTKKIFARAWSLARDFYGAVFPERSYVWLGPAIGPCCYTRRRDDPSTVLARESWHPGNFDDEGETVRFDLHGEIASQVRGAGIPEKNIFRFPLCTSCNTDRLYSYRAGDANDRILLLAKLGNEENREKI